MRSHHNLSRSKDMALDPKKHADWEIAQDAEKTMKTVYQLGNIKAFCG